MNLRKSSELLRTVLFFGLFVSSQNLFAQSTLVCQEDPEYAQKLARYIEHEKSYPEELKAYNAELSVYLERIRSWYTQRDESDTRARRMHEDALRRTSALRVLSQTLEGTYENFRGGLAVQFLEAYPDASEQFCEPNEAKTRFLESLERYESRLTDLAPLSALDAQAAIKVIALETTIRNQLSEISQLIAELTNHYCPRYRESEQKNLGQRLNSIYALALDTHHCIQRLAQVIVASQVYWERMESNTFQFYYGINARYLNPPEHLHSAPPMKPILEDPPERLRCSLLKVTPQGTSLILW